MKYYMEEDRSGSPIKFPMKLMQLLDGREGKYDHIISWTPDGLCFTVLSPKQLEAVILPTVFNTKAKYSSFQRKLYRWGFLKKYHHADDHTYFHKSFIRGEPELCDEKLTRPYRQKRKSSHRGDDQSASTATTSSVTSSSTRRLYGLRMSESNEDEQNLHQDAALTVNRMALGATAMDYNMNLDPAAVGHGRGRNKRMLTHQHDRSVVPRTMEQATASRTSLSSGFHNNNDDALANFKKLIIEESILNRQIAAQNHQEAMRRATSVSYPSAIETRSMQSMSSIDTSSTRSSNLSSVETGYLLEELTQLRRERLSLLLANELRTRARGVDLPEASVGSANQLSNNLDLNILMQQHLLQQQQQQQQSSSSAFTSPMSTMNSGGAGPFSAFNNDQELNRERLLRNGNRMNHKEIIASAMNDLVTRQSMLERRNSNNNRNQF